VIVEHIEYVSGIMRKLTTDHSYVETLVKGGSITKEEAKHHPKKNMLMKALRMWGNSRTRCYGKKFPRWRYNSYDIRWTDKYG